MTRQLSITLASDIDLVKFAAGASFTYKRVIDLRCTENGNARPIQEQILKRLKYWFVNYEQLPIDFDTSFGPKISELLEHLEQDFGDVLVLTDNISKLADIFTQRGILFQSNELYVVENRLDIDTQPRTQKPSDTPYVATAG